MANNSLKFSKSVYAGFVTFNMVQNLVFQIKSSLRFKFSYKFIDRKVSMKQAINLCRSLGPTSSIFTPSDWDETDILKNLAREGYLVQLGPRNPIWLGVKLSKVFKLISPAHLCFETQKIS